VILPGTQRAKDQLDRTSVTTLASGASGKFAGNGSAD